MADPYPFRALAAPEVRQSAVAAFVGLAGAAFVGGSAFAAGEWALTAFAVVVLLVSMVTLAQADRLAREVSRE